MYVSLTDNRFLILNWGKHVQRILNTDIMQVRIQTMLFLKECAPKISTMLNGHSILHKKLEV
jgi:hypothetical protein